MSPITLALAGAFLLPLSAIRAQRVELRIAGKAAPNMVSLFQYDTLYALEAVAIDTRGRRVPAAKPALEFHMWSVAKLVPTGTGKGTVVALTTGTAFATATWARSDGRVMMDTLLITVPRPRAMALEACWDFAAVETDAGFVRRCVPVARATAGESRCVFVTATDRRGAYITGVDPGLKSSAPAVAALAQGPTSCPDTTVNPYKLAYPITAPPW